MEKKEFLLLLREYVKGKVSKYELIDGDPSVYDVKENSSNKGLSEIKLNLGTEFILKSLNLFDEDVWFYKVINHPYSDYDIFDSSSIREDFREGYDIWNYFDSENEELLVKIAKYGFNMNFDIDDTDSRKKLAGFLENTFEKEIGSLLDDFTHQKNIAAREHSKETINKELNDVFSDSIFEFNGNDVLSTTVGELIFLYYENDKLYDPVKKLIKNYLSKENYNLGNWYENSWDFDSEEYFDRDSFNRAVNWQLEKIYDAIMDDEDDQKIKSYIQLINNLSKKYDFGVYYELPKSKHNYAFSISSVDRDTLKIVVYLNRNKDGVIKKLMLSEENFYHLLYQPELFNFDELYNF